MHMILATVLAGTSVIAQSQETNAGKNSAERGQREQKIQRVYPLKYASPQEVAELLENVIVDCETGIDLRTNSIVVSTTAQYLPSVEQLVQTLDREAVENTNIRTAIIRVNLENADNLRSLIHTIASSNIRASYDEVTGILVVRGSKSDIEAIHELIAEIESSEHINEHAELQNHSLVVHYYMIQTAARPVQSEADEDAISLPPALKKVSEALAENGLYDPIFLHSVVIHANEGNKYHLVSDLGPGETSTATQIQGAFEVVEQDKVMLETFVELFRKGSNDERRETLLEVSSEFVVPMGDYVILASSPTPYGNGDAILLVVRVTELPE